MREVMKNHIRNEQSRKELSSKKDLVKALESGLLFIDASGEVLWMTQHARRSINGALRHVELPMRKDEQAVNCFISTIDIPIDGEARSFAVAQILEQEEDSQRDLHGLIDTAVAEVMAEPSWITRPLTEKLKAWCHTAQPTARAADIEMLTAREREILALICEGRTDAQMGQTLGLSQNTVRNHVASLFRKIDVNRRSAAIIWARERGITRYDVDTSSRRRR